MKIHRKVLFPVSFALLMIVILSSCTSMRDQFSKQKYTGFKVRHQGLTKETEPVSRVKPDAVVKHKRTADHAPVITENTHEHTVQANTGGTRPDLREQKRERVLEWKQKEVKLHPVHSEKRSMKHAKPEMPGHKSTPPAWVLVLLCIFIPPLAIYLVENTSTRFWVSLICCVLLVTWIISIILAFIACFGS
jgi:uncharacterized membrane protein YqaE (UPF0057 family)